MSLLSKWNQRVHEITGLPVQPLPLSETVSGLVNQFRQLWWSCDGDLPAFDRTYSALEQAANEKQLERLTDGLIHELKRIPPGEAERQAWQNRLRGEAIRFAQTTLDLEPRHIDFIEGSGMIAASQAFARMARQFDPRISAEDIYQAGRNVMTMNFIQLLLGLPVEVTPAVFAYSMLYPYTDNYLDDPAISPTTKVAFNHRFQARLQGEKVRPANEYEVVISRLVEMIETQYERARYPLVYDSLLAIHLAQARSLKLVAPGALPYEQDVLGISFEKGGTSVLADGYLVAGWLTQPQMTYMFAYGAYTQLMDDLEDVLADRREGRLSIFSHTAGRWPLDALTNRTLHFGQAIFQDLSAFESPSAGPLQEIIARSIDPILIDTAGRVGQFYNRSYLRAIEKRLPFRFASLKKQREKLNRKKVSLGVLVEHLLG